MKQHCVSLFVLLLIILFGSSCKSNEERIKSQWKYESGHHFGDWLDFTGETWTMRNDTIYNDQIPFAIVVAYEEGSPGHENKIALSTLDGKSTGTYTDKMN